MLSQFTSKSSLNKFEDEIPVVENVLGNGFKIALNTRYINEAVKASKSDFVRLTFTGSAKPLLIWSAELKQLILPMRLS